MPNIIHKNQEHLDSLVIGSGHSIMAGYIPPSVPVTEISINGLRKIQRV